MAASNVMSMGEHHQRTGVSRRRARLRHLVVRGEAMVMAATLLLLVGPIEVGPPSVPEVPASGPERPATSTAIRVAVIGDSLISESVNEQYAALRARGYDVEVFGSRGKAMDTPWIQARLAEVAADPGIDIVVVATAANDNLGNGARATRIGAARALSRYRSSLTSMLTGLGDRCAVLVDARDIAAAIYAPGFAPRSNAVLRQVAAARPRTEVVPWADLSRSHGPDWFAQDLEHFGGRGRRIHSAGAVAYADAIARGVDRCAARRDRPGR